MMVLFVSLVLPVLPLAFSAHSNDIGCDRDYSSCCVIVRLIYSCVFLIHRDVDRETEGMTKMKQDFNKTKCLEKNCNNYNII